MQVHCWNHLDAAIADAQAHPRCPSGSMGGAPNIEERRVVLDEMWWLSEH